MDTLISLRVLAAVAEYKSFTFVSERMNLSPAMTSKHVQYLEARVGARLLNRNSRNVSVTEAGARYLQTVRPLLEGLDEAEAQVGDTALAPRGNLKVSAPIWMANPLFTRTVANYHAKNPNVVLNLDLSGRKINLVEGGIDLALRVTKTLDEGLIARKLATVTFKLVASPECLKRWGRPKSVEDLHGAPFLNYSQVGADGHLRYGQGAEVIDIRFSPVLRSENETLLHLAAREGMGFTFLPHWLAEKDVSDGLLENVLADVSWPQVPLNAIYPDRSYLPAKIRSFVDFLAGPEGIGTEF